MNALFFQNLILDLHICPTSKINDKGWALQVQFSKSRSWNSSSCSPHVTEKIREVLEFECRNARSTYRIAVRSLRLVSGGTRTDRPDDKPT